MADEEQKTDDVQTEETQEEAVESKAYGEKDVQEMVSKAVEEATGRLNSEFQKKFSEIKKEKEEAEKGKLTMEEENRKMIEEMRLENKSKDLIAKSIKAYSEAGLPVPDDEVLLDMIRPDSDDPLRVVNYNIKNFSEIKEKTKQQTLEEGVKKNGRKVTDVNQPGGRGIFDYTKEQTDQMTDDEFEAAFNRAK